MLVLEGDPGAELVRLLNAWSPLSCIVSERGSSGREAVMQERNAGAGGCLETFINVYQHSPSVVGKFGH